MSTVHPGQMVTKINFKFYRGLRGIEIILASCDVIILDKLDKTVKINIFIKVINRDIHSITILIIFTLHTFLSAISYIMFFNLYALSSGDTSQESCLGTVVN